MNVQATGANLSFGFFYPRAFVRLNSIGVPLKITPGFTLTLSVDLFKKAIVDFLIGNIFLLVTSWWV